ncbi:MAG: substrate-binding domain-containing protein [Candidatus Bathyarchaeota archaeon]|nr:substrate-binding domain-containing protein [Candidatus Bathyarchaeota archaeon]
MTEKKGISINQKTAVILAVVIVVGVVGAVWYFNQPVAGKTRLIVSTTTSLYETGFLSVLKKSFETQYPQYNVSFISQGTGLALATAARGDADLVLVHAPSSEVVFLSNGTGVNRKIVAYNYFLIVGPASDPAGIKGLSAVDALKKIAAAGEAGTAMWVSRGDKSGTNTKEISLWKLAGFDATKLAAEKAPSGDPWYLSAGAGMTATLQLANQKNAYTITDVASFLTNTANNNIQLVQYVGPEKNMLNVYSVMVCNPAKNTRGTFEAAMTFERYLVSTDGQNLLGTFGVQGKTVFSPWIPTLTAGTDTTTIEWVKSYAYLQGTECPTQYRLNADDLYK